MTTVEMEMSWAILNAYVDGELDRVMSAKVAAAVAQDATLAARVATLSKLKASVHQLESSARQMPPLPIRFQGRRFAAWRIYAVAASLVMVLTAGLLIHLHPASKVAQTWLDEALAAQQHWLASASRNNPDERTIVTIDAAKAARPLDLSDAQLKLVYVAQAPSSIGGETTFLGYRGPHGCMVGFWIGSPQDGLGSAPKSLDAGDFRVRAWRDQVAGYALIARGMDPVRIDHLAEAVAQLVDPGHVVDDGIRTALRDVTRTGAACRV